MFSKNRKRKLFAIVLAALMALPFMVTPVFAQTATFRDVPATHFAFEAINWVSDPANGAFMVGDAGNNFRPSSTVNKFEAAQIYAMAAGFRHVTFNLPPEEREIFERSAQTWQTLLSTLATQFPASWNRTVDREIAYLLYLGVLTPAEVQGFVTRTGQTEQRPLLTRQQAVAWTVRLVGQGAQAQAVQLPPATPFRDDAAIAAELRRYVYHAQELGIIGGAGGYLNPTAAFTRAEMAVMIFNALGPRPDAPVQSGGTPSTVSGTITNVHLDTHVTITSAAGEEVFPIAQNAVIMIDNVQRTPAFLREGMTTTVLIDGGRNIISLVARSAAAATTPVTGNGQTAFTDEGFVTDVTGMAVTIRIQRVRISGQIIDEERTFILAEDTVIARGGLAVDFDDIQVGDIAFFSVSGTVITQLELMERERTILGILTELRPPALYGTPVLIVEETDGASYELRVQPGTEFSRGQAVDLNWDDLRIGDAIIAEVEFDRLVRVHAIGERSTADGRLTEIRITERNTELTIIRDDGTDASFFVRTGVFDVYTLRIGMQLRINLDSREVTNIQVLAAQAQPSVVSGYIQSVRANNTIIVVEGQGASARTHTIAVNNNTTIMRGTAALSFEGLRGNMQVHIVLTAPGSNTARTITILQ